MKSPILVVVFLQLVIIKSATTEVYHFGDIIAFPRRIFCSCGPVHYKHYAVYVGNEPIPGRAPGQDIFHRTGWTKFTATCVFGTLSSQGYHYKDNYLDHTPGFVVGSHAAILRRIKAMIKMCRAYHLFRNNCEHLATFVRYGKKRSQQRGTVGGFVWKVFRKVRRLFGKRSFSLTPAFENISCRELCLQRASLKLD